MRRRRRPMTGCYLSADATALTAFGYLPAVAMIQGLPLEKIGAPTYSWTLRLQVSRVVGSDMILDFCVARVRSPVYTSIRVQSPLLYIL